MRAKVLCVEDDATMQVLIQGGLKDFAVTMTASLQDAERELRANSFDAVVLDILLPDGDGLKFWARMVAESNFADVPVIFLTGQTEISNKLLAFSVGAEDFITKPFDPLELQARVGRRLKSKAKSESEQLVRRIADLEIDLGKQRAVWMHENKEIDLALTSIELKLLALMSRRLDQVYSREQILSSVWGNSFVSDRTVDSHIAHLRAKINDTKVEIQTVKNFGYRLSSKR